MPKSTRDLPELSGRDCARVLGIGLSQFYSLQKRGHLPLPNERRTYPVDAVVKSYVAYVERGRAGELRARVDAAKAEALERRNAAALGELVPRSDVLTAINLAAKTYAAWIDGFGPRINPRLSGLDEPARLAALREGTTELRRSIAEGLRNLADASDGAPARGAA